MSKPQKVILGILTVAPFIAIPIFIVKLIFLALQFSNHRQEPDTAMILTQLAGFAVPLIIGLLIRFGLMIFYIIHALNNPTIQVTEKIIWIILFFLTGTMSFMIYWIIRIWNNHEMTVPSNPV